MFGCGRASNPRACNFGRQRHRLRNRFTPGYAVIQSRFSSMLSASFPRPAHHEGEVVQPASQLNRVIWMLWLQGFDSAPEVVRVCLHSWKARNPTWNVIELSDENLPDYVDSDSLSALKNLDVKRQKLANLIRMYLISRHGGVWVDATCFCCQPLDKWLPSYMDSGFFGFRDPGPDRIVANWFLAARKGNLLASTFYEKHRDFFLKHRFARQTHKDRARVNRISTVLNRNATLSQLWTYPVMTRTLKTYPYFIFHYHFARIVRENAACREIWNRTPSFSARIPLKMSYAGLFSPMTPQLLNDLSQAKDPFYKLNWRYREESLTKGCILDHIMRSIT
ncbi:MAG: capsular polysaccharide synthesis protein [Acidobacteriota bacterium]